MLKPAHLFASLALVALPARALIFGGTCEDAFTASSAALLFEGEIVFLNDVVEPRTVLCSAVLVAPDVALTGAHCVEIEALGAISSRTDRLAIAFDDDLVAVFDEGASFPDDAIEVRETVILEGFDAQAFGATPGLGETRDVALLFLDDVADVPPAVVSEIDPIVGTGLTASGYGSTDPRGPQPGSVGARQCAFTFLNEVGPHEVQLGAGGDSARRCSGDSGGPSFDEDAALLHRLARVRERL